MIWLIIGQVCGVKQKKSNLEAAWLKLEKQRVSGISKMETTNITVSDISRVLKKAQNWIAPGPDMVQNFWYKHLTCVHPVLDKWMQNIINNPEFASSFMLEEITYMLPKKPDAHSPSDFRPLACLPTIYRFLTAVISDEV